LKTSNYSLVEHCLRGDSVDGITNVLSDDDTLITVGKRQKAITKVMVQNAKDLMFNPEQVCPDHTSKIKYFRNKSLIDHTMIPQNIVYNIEDEYERLNKHPPGNGLYTYCIEFQLREIFKNLGDFE
jgi:hypothetical protein